MINRIIMAAFAVTLTMGVEAQAGFPKFHPQDSCSTVGTVTRIFPKIGGTYTQNYHRFKSWAGGNGSNYVYIDFWVVQSTDPLKLHVPYWNNIGHNCIDHTYNQVRGFCSPALPPVPGSQGGTFKSWMVDTDNGSNIDWDKWMSNETTGCPGSNFNPEYIAYYDANDQICGFGTVTAWDSTSWDAVNGYQDAANISANVSMYQVNGSWNSPAIGVQAWTGVQASWAKIQMGAAAGYGYLFK